MSTLRLPYLMERTAVEDASCSPPWGATCGSRVERHSNAALPPVRLITPADAAGLVWLWRETWTATYGPSLGAAVLDRMLEALDQDVRTMLPGTGERGYCLAVCGRIVGSAIVVERGGTAHLWGMYVLPSHQRRGVGSRLLAAVAAGVTASVRLEARVLASSPWARAFYARHGFRPIGEETIEIIPGTTAAATVLTIDLDHLRRTIHLPEV